ncbi:MAG: phospholipase D-like domain-containing protein, partial [Thermodesulfovibrionales bacterium]|nr:phospholipase D-like domain-containing protein [Thermodesulfovibrionales bacterium]
MSKFITNSGEKSLRKRLNTLISKSEELKFLTGFFYFSGIRELYETLNSLHKSGYLKEEHLKILVGLNVDKGAFGIYETAKIKRAFNLNSLKEDLYKSLRIAFNSADLDTKETYEQIEFFIKLLGEQKLILRKTRQPNHAKLYLFKMNETIRDVIPNLFITGSSNLTRAGLESQEEFNVEVKDYGFDEAEKYFDRLWNDSIPLSSEDINRLTEILTKETMIRQITPFIAYTYLLRTYLELHRGKGLSRELIKLMEDKGYKPYTYQTDAVSEALANCDAHGGTLIADVVGLGKTVIACMTAKALGKRGMVICPPHLIGDEDRKSGWRKYLSDFKLWDWEIRSVGKLEEALEFVKDNEDIEVIIVDEAHRFRNERTESYHNLKEICRGKTVLLLTATPFNNRPSDLFAIIKLFTIPKKSTIILDENLESRFAYYEVQFRKLAYIKNYWNSRDKKRKERAKRYYKELFASHTVEIERVKDMAMRLAK